MNETVERNETDMYSTENIARLYSYKGLADHDVIEWVKPLLLGGGWIIDHGSGKIRMALSSQTWDGPWIHSQFCKHRRCDLWHKIIFSVAKIFPYRCLECWKVVVRPRNILEQFRLLEYQGNYVVRTQKPCKCGIEPRLSVYGRYGGYFYFDSLEEGRAGCEKIKRDLDIIIPNAAVFLKRYCTEFEHTFGPSDKMVVSKEDHRKAKLIEDFVDLDATERANVQSPIVRVHVARKWIDDAWDHGDIFAKLFNDGEALYEPYVTYDGNNITPLPQNVEGGATNERS